MKLRTLLLLPAAALMLAAIPSGLQAQERAGDTVIIYQLDEYEAALDRADTVYPYQPEGMNASTRIRFGLTPNRYEGSTAATGHNVATSSDIPPSNVMSVFLFREAYSREARLAAGHSLAPWAGN